MHSENPFELSTNAFEGGTGPLVAHIRVKAEPAHLPPLEGMRQHEQFGLGVDRRPDCRTRQSGVANFAGIGGAAAVRPVALAATAIFPGSKTASSRLPRHHLRGPSRTARRSRHLSKRKRCWRILWFPSCPAVPHSTDKVRDQPRQPLHAINVPVLEDNACLVARKLPLDGSHYV